MRLRPAALTVTLAVSLLAVPPAADAEQPGKVVRIGWILGGTLELAGRCCVEPFRQGLRELGYVEGQNIAIEYRGAAGRLERLPELAAELVRLKVHVIVAAGTPTVKALKEATSTIPIVMTAVADPVGSGLIASLARPGGNVTGLTLLAGIEIVGKQLVS